eukprot:s819_g13.t1
MKKPRWEEPEKRAQTGRKSKREDQRGESQKREDEGARKGAALHVSWLRFFVAGAILYRDGVENRKALWYEAVSSALNFPFLKEASQNCFVLDAVNLEYGGSLAELLRSGTLRYTTLQ